MTFNSNPFVRVVLRSAVRLNFLEHSSNMLPLVSSSFSRDPKFIYWFQRSVVQSTFEDGTDKEFRNIVVSQPEPHIVRNPKSEEQCLLSSDD
jgi:hypothetical protein